MTVIYDAADTLLECVRDELEQTMGGVPDRVCVVPGAELAWDNCECGQLTVHMTQRFPSKVFPAQDASPMQQCVSGYIVVTYVVTILRCVPVGDEQGPPSCVALEAAAQVQAEDAVAVWKGVLCCLDDDDREFAILNQAFVGPAGSCAGSTLTVAVGFTGTESLIHDVFAGDSGTGSAG